MRFQGVIVDFKNQYSVTNVMHFLFSLLRIKVAQWLRHCTTNRKVAGSIPDGVIGIFH
jgi:hypothetical protein